MFVNMLKFLKHIYPLPSPLPKLNGSRSIRGLGKGFYGIFIKEQYFSHKIHFGMPIFTSDISTFNYL